MTLFRNRKRPERRRWTRRPGEPHGPSGDQPRGQRRYFLVAALLLALAASAVGWTIWQLRRDAVRTTVAETGNIASILAWQLARSVDSIDAILLEIKKSVEQLDLDQAHQLRTLLGTKPFHDALVHHRDRQPWIFNIAVADHTGRVVASSVAWPNPGLDVADREYFLVAREQTVDQLNVSVPIQNRIDGSQSIIFSRRLMDDGVFIGVVYVSVNSTYFESIYGSVQSINSLLFTLVRKDGTILFRHPYEPGAIGRKLTSGGAWLEAIEKGRSGFQVLAQNDGNIRFVSSRAVPPYPLFVNMSVTEDAALANWRKRASAIGIGSAILLLSSIGFLISVSRQMRRLNVSEARLAHMAHYDSLTGLANRTLFESEISTALQRMKDQGQQFFLFMLDLDAFKAVNDVFGHAIGDGLLKAAAGRLKTVVGADGLAARLGGDEFAVLMPVLDDEAEAARLARDLIRSIASPYGIDGRPIVIGTSIGIALAPNDGLDSETLKRNADAALYASKAAGRNGFRFYDPTLDARAHAVDDEPRDSASQPTAAHAA